MLKLKGYLTMLVSYHNRNEILVCTLDKEHILIEDCFTRGGRDLDDYERNTYYDGVAGFETNALPQWAD